MQVRMNWIFQGRCPKLLINVSGYTTECREMDTGEKWLLLFQMHMSQVLIISYFLRKNFS